MSDWYTLDEYEQPIQINWPVGERKSNSEIWPQLKTHANGLLVSTVFLGLDHRFHLDEGDPLLWETMVFPTNDEEEVMSWREEYCDRYTSAAEARAGHDRVVNAILNGTPLDG